MGSKKDAGAYCIVNTYRITSSGRVPAECFTQDSRASDVSEAGDRFGQAIGHISEGGEDPLGLQAVGAPGDDVGTVADQGITLLGVWSHEPMWTLPSPPQPQTGGGLGGALPT